MIVTVKLKNSPSGATGWQLIVYDWDELYSISNFWLGITEQAVFDIPSEWVFPLRVDIMIYSETELYYRMHSTKNTLPEFYRGVFIPSYGDYYFNVINEEFVSTGVGPYTKIVEIIAPDSALAGEIVPVTFRIKNLWMATIPIWAVGVLDSELTFIRWEVFWVPAGETYSYSGSFTMPDRDVVIHAYTYFMAEDGYQYLDDSASKNVNLLEVAPALSDFEIRSFSKI